MHYNKLYSTLVGSSLWTEDRDTRLLFITMLAMADRNGIVYGTRIGLARLANIEMTPFDAVGDPDCDPFAKLMAPDCESGDILRNPENQGRRIEEIEGGFRLINFNHYQTLMASDTRKEQNRLAQRSFRQKQKESADSKKNVSKRNQASAIVSAGKPSDADADVQANTCTRVPVSNWLTQDDLWIELQRILPQPEIDNHIGLWIRRIKENRHALYEAIADYKDKRNKGRIKNVAAWLTQRYQNYKTVVSELKAATYEYNMRNPRRRN